MRDLSKLEMDLRNLLLGERIPLDICDGETGLILIPANQKIKAHQIKKMVRVVQSGNELDIDPSPIRSRLQTLILHHTGKNVLGGRKISLAGCF